MWLRNVEAGDVEAYVRMRCDPVMMAELGGPLPSSGMAEKVARDVEDVAADISWIKMIVPDQARPYEVAGTVAIWAHESDGGLVSEIGWMVLPEFQGRGLAKRATRALLERAAEEDRWGRVHAYPAIANGPSNGICRSLGFCLLGEVGVDFAGRRLRSHHWVINPATDLGAAGERAGAR